MIFYFVFKTVHDELPFHMLVVEQIRCVPPITGMSNLLYENRLSSLIHNKDLCFIKSPKLCHKWIFLYEFSSSSAAHRPKFRHAYSRTSVSNLPLVERNSLSNYLFFYKLYIVIYWISLNMQLIFFCYQNDQHVSQQD